MSGGGGGASTFGKGETTTNSAAADSLAKMAQDFGIETTPSRQGILNMIQDVQATGTSDSALSKATVESQRMATSRAIASIKDDMARQGLAGTPFGENIIANTRQSGELAVAAATQELARGILSMAPNFVLGLQQTAGQGFASAIPGQMSVNERAFGQTLGGGGGSPGYKGTTG